MDTKKISVVVPVKNGMDTLERFIDGIKKQTLFDALELIIVDSGSNDGSVNYLSALPFVKLVSIDPKTFNHGATRNLAVTHCNGDFILMTVQDAWTTDAKLLERMVNHFKDDETVGVCGYQVVPKIKGYNPHQWFRPQNVPKPKVVQFKDGAFNNLSPKEKYENCGWDNVIAMYRASTLKKIPFAATSFAEDMLWAKEVLGKGYKIVYDHRNRVNHYHHRFPDYIYKRIFIELYSIYKHFGYKMDMSVTNNMYIKILIRNIKWKLKPYWFFFNVRALKARQRANTIFTEALQYGDKHLDKVYAEVCGTIPQGKTIKN